MKICFCSLSNRENIYSRTFPIMKAYCDKWGHQFIPYHEILDTCRFPAWSKILLCNRIIKTSLFDYVVWIDDDILLTNMDINIADYINDENKDKNILIQNEKSVLSINSGLVIFKSNQKTTNILNEVWELGKDVCEFTHPWEQRALKTYMKNNLEEFHLFTNKELQSFHPECGLWSKNRTWKKDDFSCHLARIKRKNKREILLDMLIKELYSS